MPSRGSYEAWVYGEPTPGQKGNSSDGSCLLIVSGSGGERTSPSAPSPLTDFLQISVSVDADNERLSFKAAA